MNEELLTVINTLKDNFSYDDISDYQNLLLIIYNSIFLYEDELTSDVKYKIYEALSTVISNVELIQKNSTSNCRNKQEDILLLESLIIPYYLKDGINPRYDRILGKDNKHKKNIERLKK